MDGEEGGRGDFKKKEKKRNWFFFQKKREKISFITPKPRRGCIFQQTELHQEFFVFFFVVLIERLLQPSILPCIKFFKKEKEKFAIVFR